MGWINHILIQQYHIAVLEASSKRSFSTTLGKTSKRGSTRVFLSKVPLVALGQHVATNHQHRTIVVQNVLILKTRVSGKLLQNSLREAFVLLFRDISMCVLWWAHWQLLPFWCFRIWDGKCNKILCNKIILLIEPPLLVMLKGFQQSALQMDKSSSP